MPDLSSRESRSGRRLVVVTGPGARAAARATVLVRASRRAGWRVVRGWAAPLSGERIVCTGTIATADDARRALLAALGGAGLIVAARLEPETLDEFLDDLRRVGQVEVVSLDGHREPLDPEQRSILARIAEGLTLPEAAAELGLSPRTAERRVAAARRSLGVRTTAEAVVAAMTDAS